MVPTGFCKFSCTVSVPGTYRYNVHWYHGNFLRRKQIWNLQNFGEICRIPWRDIFYSGFFHRTASSGPISGALTWFWIWSNFHLVLLIRNRHPTLLDTSELRLPSVQDNGELRLCGVLVTGESISSPMEVEFIVQYLRENRWTNIHKIRNAEVFIKTFTVFITIIQLFNACFWQTEALGSLGTDFLKSFTSTQKYFWLVYCDYITSI